MIKGMARTRRHMARAFATGISLAMLACAMPAAAQGPPPASVRVDAARLEIVQERRLVTGELRAVHRARVATEEPGLVMDMPVQAGQRVRKGDLLAQLDSKRLEIELARLASEGQAATAARDERQTDLDWRLRDLENLQALSKGGASNPKELYDAESQVAIARTRIAAADFAIAVIQGNIELMRKRVEDMRITAPFDGMIVVKLIEQGEWLAEGDAAVEMVSTQEIEAWLDVPQQFSDAIIDKSPTVAVNIEATGASIDASNLWPVPNVDSRARTFPLIVRLDNEAGALAPGMSVTAWVPTGDFAEQLTIHKDALLRGPTGTYVYVARSTGPDAPAIATPVDVQVLFALDDRFVARTMGLNAGDQLIVEGNERLFPTAPVIPLPQQDAHSATTSGSGPPGAAGAGGEIAPTAGSGNQ
jgi:RND family efflux transporter MFP subunit